MTELLAYDLRVHALLEHQRRADVPQISALANESVRAIYSGSNWREVPFAKAGPAGVVEGAIDMVGEGAESVSVLDFKTDAVKTEGAKELERLYSVQLTEYLHIARSVSPKPTKAQLIFLARPGQGPHP